MSRGVFVPALEAPVDIGDLAVDRIVPPVAAQIAAVGSANAIVSEGDLAQLAHWDRLIGNHRRVLVGVAQFDGLEQFHPAEHP
jgi:hypothetical protein